MIWHPAVSYPLRLRYMPTVADRRARCRGICSKSIGACRQLRADACVTMMTAWTACRMGWGRMRDRDRRHADTLLRWHRQLLHAGSRGLVRPSTEMSDRVIHLATHFRKC